MTSRKKKAPLADLEKSSAKFWNPQNLLPVVLVIVLAGIPFAVGKYIEFSTHDPFDSSLNIYSAQQIVNGGKLDVDVFSQRSPRDSSRKCHWCRDLWIQRIRPQVYPDVNAANCSGPDVLYLP